MSAPRPASPASLADELADRIAALRAPAVVALDGAPATAPDELAGTLVEPLRARGVPAGHVEAATYWRDASLRLEYGHEDADAYLDWLDAAALRREVIEPMHAGGRYLPTLRDPASNRATRAEPVLLGPAGVVLVSGPLLLRHGLPFDLSVHLWNSAPALARRTAADQQWTLAAFARYESQTAPAAHADIVVRCDDPRHPAVVGL